LRVEALNSAVGAVLALFTQAAREKEGEKEKGGGAEDGDGEEGVKEES
jgi:hypothetical protein